MNYASVNNNIIEALIGGNFKFPNYENALKFLERLQKQFILAKNHEELMKEGKLRLWIKGYMVTAKEQEEGGLGNFCMVSIAPQPDGTCRISAIKEEQEIKNHPSRKRKAARMPNYGHPTLRLAKKSTEFDKFIQVAEILLDMHNEFPETTIPGKDRLDLMVYSRPKDGGKPTTDRIRLVIKPKAEKFILAIEEKAAPQPKPEKSREEGDIMGKFTAMALMKKKKKK